MDTIVTEKRCSKCKIVKPLSCYWVDRKRKDELTPQCKDCQRKTFAINKEKNKDKRNAKSRERYYSDIEKNRARARESAKAHRAKVGDGYKEYLRQHKSSHSEEYKGYFKKYYENNKQKVKEAHLNWLSNNKDKNREYKANRRARKLKAGGTFTAKQFKDLCEKYHNVCLCCGSSGKLVADHVVPLSEGGNNSINNIQPLCFSCNARKYTKTIDYRY